MKYKTIQYTVGWYASCYIKLPLNICNNSQATIHPSCSFSPKQHVAEKIVNTRTESLENTMQEKNNVFYVLKIGHITSIKLMWRSIHKSPIYC